MKKYTTIFIITLFFIYRIDFKNYNDEILKIKEFSKNGYNTNYAILIDYSKHSGLNRMLLVNLKTKEVEKSFLVMNGRGGKFSNVVGSNNSSLGISVIESRGHSKYGNHIKYTLKGLEKTNSNIKKRNIVLHSSKYSVNFQTFPIRNARSYGCPTVSIKSLEYIDKLIQKQKNKKIIIYSFI